MTGLSQLGDQRQHGHDQVEDFGPGGRQPRRIGPGRRGGAEGLVELGYWCCVRSRVPKAGR